MSIPNASATRLLVRSYYMRLFRGFNRAKREKNR